MLDALVATRRNVLVTGDAAALPSALAAFGREVPADRRVVAIGAAARSRSGWIDLAPTGRCGGPPARGGGAASRPPGRRRADRPRGRRAACWSRRAARTGSCSRCRAARASEALSRFGALAAVGLGATATATPLVASAFDLYVHVVAADGGARIIEIGEPRADGRRAGARRGAVPVQRGVEARRGGAADCRDAASRRGSARRWPRRAARCRPALVAQVGRAGRRHIGPSQAPGRARGRILRSLPLRDRAPARRPDPGAARRPRPTTSRAPRRRSAAPLPAAYASFLRSFDGADLFHETVRDRGRRRATRRAR